MRGPALLLSFVVLATWSCAIAARGQSTDPAAPAAPAATQPASKPFDVPVRQVVLFSSGVGYFEHFGSVRDNGATELRFKTEDIRIEAAAAFHFLRSGPNSNAVVVQFKYFDRHVR